MLIASLALLLSCGGAPTGPGLAPALDATKEPGAAVARPFDRMDRATFNARAISRHVPVFWSQDGGTAGLVEPGEVVALRTDAPMLGALTADGAFTPAFVAAYEALAADVATPLTPRQAKAQRELDQGRATLVHSDLRGVSAGERTAVTHLLKASRTIEELYGRQRGAFELGKQIPADDTVSRALYYRNQGPWCESPAMESVEGCSALDGDAPEVSGLYPADLQTEGFCARLEADHPELLTPFTAVVRDDKGRLTTQPTFEHWPTQHAAIATELRAASAALPADEPAFKAYLDAAATAFGDGDWFVADAAWAAMNAQNSRWYLRIAPDETYFDPCDRHAGYHMVLARINPASVKWQDLLDPLKGEMEKDLAVLSGPPYVARDVAFSLPDFIDIVLNAGDARANLGATTGQSLPNWGPVAEAGGRTVAMTNLFKDADSVSAHRAKVESLMCKDAMTQWTDDPEPLLMSTVLHEAAHNLGPASGYKVDGKTDEIAFGGALASVLEELKAQTAALYLTDWLADKQTIDHNMSRQAHMADLAWALGKVAQGLTWPDGSPKVYPQLSAIQLGELRGSGAVRWMADETAANGSDVGCFSVDHKALPDAVAALAKTVFEIKGSADAERARALQTRHVDVTGGDAALYALIAERWQREATTSFVYSVEL
jgi:hypothetical protein